jgi:hypothetical protein
MLYGLLCVFEVFSSDAKGFEMSGEQRICLMAAQPNQYLTLSWHRSTASDGGGGCVEVALWESSVLVRDSRDHAGTVLEFTPAQWLGLVRHIKDGKAGQG